MQKRRRDFVGDLVIGAGGLTASSLSAEEEHIIPPVSPRLFSFVGGKTGIWQVVEIRAVVGDSLPFAPKLDIVHGAFLTSDSAKWVLRGVTSNERYVTRQEKDSLIARQVSLNRTEATYSALIPIRKNAAWWHDPGRAPSHP